MQLNAQEKTLTSKLEAYQKAFPAEKIYLSFDKPYYNVGDTVWFKSFLLNADFSASSRTDKIYIELFSDSLKFIENRVILLNNGLGYGDIALNKNLREGTYTIRAYSNWQQNFGSDYFYQKSFYVGKAGEKTWLLDSYQKLIAQDVKKTLDLKIRITNIKNEPVGLKQVEVYLLNNNKRIMRAELQTTVDGRIETRIPLGNTNLTGRYSFVIVDKNDKTRSAILAVSLQETNEVDLQLMPEGGYLVNGIYGKVAFKAIGADGMGRNLTGKIINSKGESILTFNTIHKGMGNFFLLPQKGETYAAVFNINGKEVKRPLPIAKDEGTTLRIDHLSIPDSIIVYVKASELKRTDGYFLLAQSAGESIMEITLNLKNGFSILKIPKKDFPDGVIHFTLFSPESLPLNERQALLNHAQKIQLHVTSNKNSYTPRDSINLEITATKEDGSPLSGSFSMAVTDESQVKQDLYPDHIVSYFLLQSEIKGNVEDAAWYFSDQNTAKLVALDQLLLTQGWVGYEWDKVFKPNLLPKFKAEKDNLIEGRLTQLMKPASNINLTLLSLGKNIFVTDTVSDAEGKFVFKDIPLFDTVAYSIKIKNAKGKTSGANIMVNEFVHAKDITSIEPIKPWYNNPDSTLLNYYHTIVKKEKEFTVSISGTTLNEVEIKGKKKLKDFIETTAWDSKLFMEINEAEMKKNPQKTLFDLLKEKIPGLTIGTFWTNACSGRPGQHSFPNYVIGTSLVSHIMIDKSNTHLAATGIDDEYNSNKDGVSKTAIEPDVFSTNQYILNHLSAAEIVNINIYKGCAYYFLEITTRSGKGPWIAPTPGMYVFRPLPIYQAKDFYSPKYRADKSGTLSDFRSTIFWDANLVTDENGKAKVSFYAADLPSTYSIKIEGTDLLGRFGFVTKKINITPVKTNP